MSHIFDFFLSYVSLSAFFFSVVSHLVRFSSRLCLTTSFFFSVMSHLVQIRLKYLLFRVAKIAKNFSILSRLIFQKPLNIKKHYAFILSKIDHPLSSSNSYETIQGGGQSSDKSFINFYLCIDINTRQERVWS